ncbi:hypothetical protein [Limnohabitans sp.]|uniref:hypothetical protein n=1 Tax=Limnohabitans sp. TaxID=1907725 RepID=UPI00311DE782
MLLEKILVLHEWEMNKFPFFRTMIGRHIYVCLARNVFTDKNEEEVSIKKLLSSHFFTDRAIRLKIREMEKAGFLETKNGHKDQRVVVIKPTAELRKMMEEHSLMLNRVVSQDIIILEKNRQKNE